jgi:hypothetical protein
VTRRDPSQIPVERLAQLLLQCARADASLPRRTPANDDPEHARYVAATYNRIEALPELRRESLAIRPEPPLALPLPPAAEVASNEELEELVAIALTSAHEAEDVSWQANEASRKARRGMAVAVGLAVLGIAIAGTAAVSARLYGTDDQQIAQIAGQVQAMDDLQHHIDQQLAEIHAQGTVQEASAEQPPPPAAPAADHPATLPPLRTREVSVLPAEPAVSQAQRPATSQQGESDQQNASDRRTERAATSASYAVYSAQPREFFAPRAAYRQTWTPYRPVRHYRTRIVLPRPVVYLFSSVQRSVQTLFH